MEGSYKKIQEPLLGVNSTSISTIIEFTLEQVIQASLREAVDVTDFSTHVTHS